MARNDPGEPIESFDELGHAIKDGRRGSGAALEEAAGRQSPFLDPNGEAFDGAAHHPLYEPGGAGSAIYSYYEPGGVQLAMHPYYDPHGVRLAMHPYYDPHGSHLAMHPYYDPHGSHLAMHPYYDPHGVA